MYLGQFNYQEKKIWQLQKTQSSSTVMRPGSKETLWVWSIPEKIEEMNRFNRLCVFQVLLAPPAAWVQEWIPRGGHWHAGLWRVWPAPLHWKLSLRLPHYWRQGHRGVFRWVKRTLCVCSLAKEYTTFWQFLVSKINLFIILKLWLAFGPVPWHDKPVVTHSD